MAPQIPPSLRWEVSLHTRHALPRAPGRNVTPCTPPVHFGYRAPFLVSIRSNRRLGSDPHSALHRLLVLHVKRLLPRLQLPTQSTSSYKCLFLLTFRHTPTLLRASPVHPTPCSRHSWHPSTTSTPLCAVPPKPTPPLPLGARPLPATGSTVTVRVNLPQC